MSGKDLLAAVKCSQVSFEPNWRCCCHDMAGIHRRLIAEGQYNDLCIVSISHPSCDCSFNNISVTETPSHNSSFSARYHSQSFYHFLPGLFGRSKAFLTSTLGLNSSSILLSLMSSGSDSSSFFSAVSPASVSATLTAQLRELAYTILSLILLAVGQV